MFFYFGILIKAKPLQNGPWDASTATSTNLYDFPQDYSFPDYSMPDNLTHYYDPVTQVNCALVYLIKRVSPG